MESTEEQKAPPPPPDPPMSAKERLDARLRREYLDAKKKSETPPQPCKKD